MIKYYENIKSIIFKTRLRRFLYYSLIAYLTMLLILAFTFDIFLNSIASMSSQYWQKIHYSVLSTNNGFVESYIQKHLSGKSDDAYATARLFDVMSKWNRQRYIKHSDKIYKLSKNQSTHFGLRYVSITFYAKNIINDDHDKLQLYLDNIISTESNENVIRLIKELKVELLK